MFNLINIIHKPFSIGITDPVNKEYIFAKIALTNLGVTTSGTYERFFELNGEQFSHIINPFTLTPVKKIISSTVISADMILLDVLATALVLASCDFREAIMKIFSHSDALVIENNKIVFCSEKIAKLIDI
ncbi:MAG: FAD:protein FMN transferase [Deltaproteobacteria bacterium]|nr:FAD:protein FMN transferase [Deltaproteobacteria bacterium]